VCVNWSFFCIGLDSDITYVFNNKTQKSGQMGERASGEPRSYTGPFSSLSETSFSGYIQSLRVRGILRPT
jgi:hypothetical protein